ncbi:MAG: recombinase, partial [Moraxellaceae bacterium]
MIVIDIEWDDLFARMKEQLSQHDTKAITPLALVQLVARLRPKNAYDSDEIQDNLNELITRLMADPSDAVTLHDYLLQLVANYQQINLYADDSLMSNEGFFSLLSHRIGNYFLPPLRGTKELNDIFRQVFFHRFDPVWLGNIDTAHWQQLMTLLSMPQVNTELRTQAREQVLNALMIISYRITSLSLDPEFAHAYPDLNEYESPFLVQNREILDFIQKYREYASDEILRWPPLLPDEKQALVMLDQCADVLTRIKRSTRRNGVSLSLTNILIKLDQCLIRIELLFNLLLDNPQQVQESLMGLLYELALAQHETQSVRGVIEANTELLSRQVTENASRTGGHYVSTDRRGYT